MIEESRHVLPDGLMAELTIYSNDPNVLRKASYEWLTRGVVMAGGGAPVEEYENGTRVSLGGYKTFPHRLTEGAPGKPWAYITVSPADSWDVLYNPYKKKSLDWLSGRIDECPEHACVDFGRFHSSGGNGDRIAAMSASFDEDLPSYVRLRLHVGMANSQDPQFVDGYPQSLALDVLHEFASRYPVVFGHLATEDPDGLTEYEKYLSPAEADTAKNVPSWAHRIRGYSWFLVVSGEVAGIVGGESELVQTGAFAVVERLPHGAVWLQATSHYSEYDQQAVLDVWQALRSVVIPGKLRPPRKLPGASLSHVIVFEP